jgi:hypothetical protein
MVSRKKKVADSAAQLARFREMAREVGADESPQALERAFAQLDPKRKWAPPAPKKRAKKAKI